MSLTCSNMQECCNFIHIKRNGGDGNFSTLKRGTVVILGKDESCDFRIQVPSVSARHASLRVDKCGKVYTSSLVENAPVYLNGEAVRSEALIRNKDILKVGTCSFRFEYAEGVLSPLHSALQNPTENNVATETPKKAKSPVVAKPGKENISMGTPQNASNTAVSKEKVPTPVIPRQHSVTKKPSQRSSLLSIPEQEEAVSTTPNRSTSASSMDKHVCTPADKLSSRRSLRNASLVSIPEEDEATATPSPCKRKLESTFLDGSGRKRIRKSVSFGPFLSPEFFDKTLPPSTPIKAGVLPGGMRRSLPALLSKPSPLSPSPLTKAQASIEEDEDTELTQEDESGRDIESECTTLEQANVDTETEDSHNAEDEDAQDAEGEYMPEEVEDGTQSLGDEDQEHEETNVEYSMTGFEEEDDPSSSQLDESGSDEQSVVEDSTGVSSGSNILPTPLRRAIEAKPLLRKTKLSMPSPLKREIESKPRLREKLKRSLPTPLSRAIRMKPVLRKMRPVLPTPLRKAILQKSLLKKAKKPTMPTPIRKDIESQPALKKTKQSMPTPIRKGIERQPALKKTKLSMPTPVRKGIEGKPSLKKTKQSMPTPVRRDIEGKPSLKKTKQSMPTPVRKEIEGKPHLKKTKNSMPTPIRKGIEAKPSLKKTKRSMPAELQEAIQKGTELRTNKKSLPPAICKAIEERPALRATKRALPAAIREEIVQGVRLNATKKCMPSQLLKEIIAKPQLRQTKPSLPSPLRAQIQSGFVLKKTKLSMPEELRQGIEAGAAALRHVLPKVVNSEVKSVPKKKSPFPAPRQARKRVIEVTDEASATPLPAPPSKKRKMATLASPLPFNFDHFVQNTNTGGHDLTGMEVLHSNLKVKFSASRTKTLPDKPPSPSTTVCPVPEADVSLFHPGTSDKPAGRNGTRTTRDRSTTNGKKRSTKAKQKVVSTDLDTGTKRVTRSSARGVSAHTDGTDEGSGITAMKAADALEPTVDMHNGQKKVTRNNNTRKTIVKVCLETIPEQPGPTEVTAKSDDAETRDPSRSKKTSSMKQDKSSKGRSLRHSEDDSVTHSEENAAISSETDNNRTARVTRSLKQPVTVPVKPAISEVVSYVEVKQAEPVVSSLGLKRVTRKSRKDEVTVCSTNEDVEQDVSSAHTRSKKPKSEQKSDLLIDDVPKKTTRSSKQSKESTEILSQEIASATGQNSSIPLSAHGKRKGKVAAEQDLVSSDAGKTQKALRSYKQGDKNIEQSNGTLEEPPNAKKCKLEHISNDKSTRATRSNKQMDTDVMGSVIEPMTINKKSTRPIRSNDAGSSGMTQDENNSRRVTRSSKLK